MTREMAQERDDDYLQALLLDDLAKHHPAKLTMPELVLSMKGHAKSGDESHADAVQIAVQALQEDGLIREACGEWGLTRPAARMAELPDAT
jgi:hypothetical protein